MRPFPHKILLLLALGYTLINAFKPLTIDDAAYHYYARQAAHRPLDPYGFAVFWWYQPEEANQVLAPPLLSYWWGLAIRLFGDNIFLWKLWLLPFSVLFVYALFALFRRFARGLEVPLVLMTVLSPTFLPSLNLMLDVPALSLGLTAVALFCRSVDRSSFPLAALAGLVAGLGIETKYTVLLAPGAMLLYAVFFRGLRFWPVAAVAAAQLFIVWELLVALLYGESHFFTHARLSAGAGSLIKWPLLKPMLSIIGSVGWAVTLLTLAALGVRRGGLLAAAAAGLFAFALVACYGGDLKLNETLFGPFEHKNANVLLFEQLVFALYGVVGHVIAAVAIYRLCRLPTANGRWTAVWDRVLGASGSLADRLRWLWYAGPGRAHPATWFVCAWLLLEIVGYLALTPFPAVRRVMGIIVVGTLVAGRLAALSFRWSRRRWLAYAVAGYSAVLGLFYFGVDYVDACAERDAVQQAARAIRAQDPDPEKTIWFVGHWGFQFYAEREGMRAIVPADPPRSLIPIPPRTRFKEGDWMVLPTWHITQQPFALDERYSEEMFWVEIKDRLPWHTIMCYYGGHSGVEHHTGPRVRVQVRRVTVAHEAHW